MPFWKSFKHKARRAATAVALAAGATGLAATSHVAAQEYPRPDSGAIVMTRDSLDAQYKRLFGNALQQMTRAHNAMEDTHAADKRPMLLVADTALSQLQHELIRAARNPLFTPWLGPQLQQLASFYQQAVKLELEALHAMDTEGTIVEHLIAAESASKGTHAVKYEDGRWVSARHGDLDAVRLQVERASNALLELASLVKADSTKYANKHALRLLYWVNRCVRLSASLQNSLRVTVPTTTPERQREYERAIVSKLYLAQHALLEAIGGKGNTEGLWGLWLKASSQRMEATMQGLHEPAYVGAYMQAVDHHITEARAIVQNARDALKAGLNRETLRFALRAPSELEFFADRKYQLRREQRGALRELFDSAELLAQVLETTSSGQDVDKRLADAAKAAAESIRVNIKSIAEQITRNN